MRNASCDVCLWYRPGPDVDQDDSPPDRGADLGTRNPPFGARARLRLLRSWQAQHWVRYSPCGVMTRSSSVRLLLALALSAAALLPARAADTPGRVAARPPGLAPLPRVTSPRLYVIDCGTLVYNRPEDYQLTREQVADTNMSVPCFLVIHPKGLLLFDTGLSDRLVGRPLWENVDGGYGQIKFNTLRGQLADIGVTPADITYLAISHSHFDHVGNANDYAGSIWLAQKAELDFMFGAGADPAYLPLYSSLAHARKQVFAGDHDVFGDGS